MAEEMIRTPKGGAQPDAISAAERERTAGFDDIAVAPSTAQDRDRIAQDLRHVVQRRLFEAELNLNAVLSLTEPGEAARHLHRALDELDEAIKEVRTAIVDLRSDTGRPGAASLAGRPALVCSNTARSDQSESGDDG